LPDTYAYIDPQILRTGEANARSDVFSLGSVLFFCASGGNHPLRANIDEMEQRQRQRRGELVPIPSEVDARIAAVIAACRQVDPAGRPSAETLAVLLTKWGTPEWDALAPLHLAPPKSDALWGPSEWAAMAQPSTVNGQPIVSAAQATPRCASTAERDQEAWSCTC
jgi:serine/threonine protein kinase